MDKYIKQVNKQLTCDKGSKQRIINDLQSDMSMALEAGESIDEIIARIGSPEEYVREFNNSLGVEKKSNKKLIIGLICGAVIAVCLFLGYQYLTTPSTLPIEKSQVFKQEKLLDASKEIIEFINQEDYTRLETLYSKKLKEAIDQSDSSIKDAIKQLGDLGVFKKINDYKFVEFTDKNGTFALGDVVASYEKRTVIYRLTFDKDMKLSGIYMR